MADKKISQLTTLAQADVAVTADFLPIVDTSATETKKATPQALVQAGATGATLPVALGAVGTPSYTFTGDLNTGLWSPAADTLAASTNGAEVWRVNSSGNFSLGATEWTTNPFGQTTEPRYFQYQATGTQLRLASDAGASFQAFRFTNDGGAAALVLGKARGTYASPLTVGTGDNLGDIQFRGYGGTNSRVLANVTAFVETYTSDSNISSYLEFRTSSSGSASATEKMRLTAAGDLGIGTASPQAKLEVAAGQLFINQDQRLQWNIAGSTTIRADIRGTSANAIVFGNRVGGVLTDTMVLDGSGNLGLGVTPSAWGASYKVLQLPGGAISADSTAVIEMRQNSRWSGSANVYVNNGFASNYYQYNGTHAWFTAPSGTAGNAISFTQAMTLTAAGDLGVGTTTPGQKLEVSGNQRFTGSQVGTKIENRNTGINVSTATTILDEAGAEGRVVIVNGANGGDRFCDLVFCSTAANPTVIASFTAFGTPTARTYTRNGAALQLAMASGTYVVNALALGY